MLHRSRVLAVFLAALSGACQEPAGTARATGGVARATGVAPAPSAASARDVLLITVDTLRADATGFSGNPRAETPSMDRLAARGRVYTRARAHNVVTLPSHANILTGLLPFQHGLRDNAGAVLPPDVPTLATRLAAAGYATGAFVSAFPLDRRYGLSRGFSVYDDRTPQGADPSSFRLSERPGPETVAAALAWWTASSGRPRFLWVHVFEPHAPYAPPAPFARRFARDPYLGEVAAADAALTPLLAAAGPETLVVLTSDHGESLGEHGEATHGLFAYEATLHVPLVVAGPGVEPGRDARPAGHVDIVPTVLEALGVPPPSLLAGRSLLGPSEPGRAQYFEALSASLNRGWAPLRGVVREEKKYVDLPIRELYDLAQDPAEASNLAVARPEEARSLARSIPASAREVAAREPGGGPGGIDGSPRVTHEEAARLRSLGYLAGSVPAREDYGPEDDPKSLVSADAGLHRAIDLYQRGRLAEAVAENEALVRQHPRLWLAIEQLGFLYQEQGRLADAARVLRAATSRGGAPESLRVRLALVLAEGGRGREALALAAAFEGSADAEAQRVRGIVLAENGRLGEARAALETALAAAPEDVETLADLGVIELRAGRRSAATERFREALARSPSHARARAGLAEAGEVSTGAVP